MGRVYTVQFENVTIAAASGDVDLFEISPGDDKPVKLRGLFLSQNTELGDAAEEQLRLQIVRGHATTGSGGATPTPEPVDPVDTAAGFTAETNNTTIASTGSPVLLHSETFNVRAGYQIWWPPGCEPRAHQGQTTIVVRLMAAVADDIGMSGTLYVEEA